MFWKCVFLYRLRHNKEELSCEKERFGYISKQASEKLAKYIDASKDKKVVWVHAVSVGESLSVLPFVQKMCDKGYFVVFTTTTTTSANNIRKQLPENAIHQYMPY